MRFSTREWLLNALTTVASVVFFLSILEGVLRFLPVTNSTDWTVVTEETPILSHTPDHAITYSMGWDFRYATERWSNNYGFLNDQDYVTQHPLPLIAVVGDSYVEAMLNSYENTFYGRLASAMEQTTRIYSFGVSGAQLSQYLVWAEFAAKTFGPDLLVIPIIANDFDESFFKYKRTRGFHYFSQDGSGLLHRVDRVDSTFRRIAFSSALGRYLFFHLHVGDALRNAKNSLTKLIEGDDTPARYIGNVVADVPKVQEDDGRRATDLFLNAITNASGLPAARIVFVLDAIRPSMYDAEELSRAGSSYWAKMRDHFIAEATRGGFRVVDMQTAFLRDYAERRTVFEYPTDGHWNDLAHELVAKELRESGALAIE